MNRKDILILSSNGTIDLAQIDWGTAATGETSDHITVRIYNSDLTESATSVRLNAGRADMTVAGDPAEDEDAALENGEELAAEAWIEARVTGSTTWTPIDEYDNALELGTIAAQAHVEVDIRINVPADAESNGEVGFNLIVRCV